MSRPKKEGPKAVKRSVSIDPELFKWVNEKIKIKRFSTLSHAINEALLQLKKKLDEEK
jgi:Arc/MetJ-type ribon-helix-helix transcriptional regulator